MITLYCEVWCPPSIQLLVEDCEILTLHRELGRPVVVPVTDTPVEDDEPLSVVAEAEDEDDEEEDDDDDDEEEEDDDDDDDDDDDGWGDGRPGT